jgi:hypothetical protein
MGMVAPQQRIASTVAVVSGRYGDVSRCAQERGVCRQWLYREIRLGFGYRRRHCLAEANRRPTDKTPKPSTIAKI